HQDQVDVRSRRPSQVGSKWASQENRRRSTPANTRLQTDRASRLSPLAARRLKRKPLARFPGNCQATAGVYIFVNALYRFTTALGLVFAAVVSSLAQDEVVEFDPREVGGLLSPLELTGLVVAGFVWLLYWQLLKRAILIRAFCVWFPTA